MSRKTCKGRNVKEWRITGKVIGDVLPGKTGRTNRRGSIHPGCKFSSDKKGCEINQGSFLGLFFCVCLVVFRSYFILLFFKSPTRPNLADSPRHWIWKRERKSRGWQHRAAQRAAHRHVSRGCPPPPAAANQHSCCVSPCGSTDKLPFILLAWFIPS